VQWMVDNLLGIPRNKSMAFIQLMVPATVLSAFINNNTVAQLLINVVKLWCKRLGIAPSKLLYPLSYATGFGGVCTLIGTGTNLVISETWKQQMGTSLGMFFPLLPGLCCTLVGVTTLFFLRHILPVRKSPEESFESSDEYTVELLVPTDSPLVGQTIEEAHLNHVYGGQLIEVVRFDREVTSPVPDDEFILGGDRLVFTGKIQELLSLRRSHGLVNADHHVYSVSEMKGKRKLWMANVRRNSSLNGCCMLDLDFERSNNVVLVAVARRGERVEGIPREIPLQTGDTLLLEGQKLNPRHFTNDLSFTDDVALPQPGSRTSLATAIMLGMVLLTAFNVIPLIQSCALAAVLMVVFKCCSIQQLQRSIDWNLMIEFAGALCMGQAIVSCGLTQILTDSLLYVSNSSPLLVFLLFCGGAMAATEFIQDVVVAVVTAPVGLTVAQLLGVSPYPFMVGLMLCLACTSTETNTIVSGPAGYTFADNYRISIPLNTIMFIANMLITLALFPL
ncbi:MAG: SLC13 family permease, partial [Bacteroidaceae bacterium]|nr:SLC13 family permease [Bacteroidaceae bacterium]